MNFKVSEFCHFVDGKNNLVALYNALTLGIVILDKETTKILQEAKGGIISVKIIDLLNSNGENDLLSQLIKNKLIFPLEQNADLQDYAVIQTGLNCKKIGILYLLMTDACNLSCGYCFVENLMPSDYTFSKMTAEIARSGIDLFAKALEKSSGIEEPQIIFYGGEPLANFTVVQEALEYIARAKADGRIPGNTSITINTNGTLINDNIAAALKRIDNLNLAISLDGPREIHNICRPYHNGTGSYDDVMRGYQCLRNNGIEAGFCCTINRHNVEQLHQIASWFMDELGAKSLGFNILIENYKVNGMRGDVKYYAELTAQKIIDCFRLFREKGIYEDRIMRKVNAFVDGHIYYHDCGGCGQQIVMSPNGMVGVCQGYLGTKKYFVKPDHQFNPLEHPVWEEWQFRSPLFMAQCKNCIALSICGGGCPYSADLRNGSIWELDDIFCVHAKATAEFLIKDLIEQVIRGQ